MKQHEIPKLNEEYEEYTGHRYEVMSCAEEAITGQVMVVYRSMLFGTIRCISIEEWNGKVKVLGPSPEFVDGGIETTWDKEYEVKRFESLSDKRRRMELP